LNVPVSRETQYDGKNREDVKKRMRHAKQGQHPANQTENSPAADGPVTGNLVLDNGIRYWFGKQAACLVIGCHESTPRGPWSIEVTMMTIQVPYNERTNQGAAVYPLKLIGAQETVKD
jgi:hypothetical protein